MVAYRDLMFTMFWLFAILSLIMTPVMMFYKQQAALDSWKGFAGPFSMGNFGYASNQCQITPYSLSRVPINCPYGQLGKIVSAGVIPGDASEDYQYLCNWGLQGEDYSEAVSIREKCPVRSDLTSLILSQEGVKLGNAENKFVFNSLGDIFDTSKAVDASCHEGAKVFVQFECHMDDATRTTKKEQAAMISCLGVLLVCVYLTVIYYFKRASDLNQMEWDIQTITPGDYTAQLEISQKAYDFFLKNIYSRESQRKSDLSIGECLKTYIKRELERVLTEKLLEMKPTNDNLKATEVKIADIVFAFNNARLITLLKQRGQHIIWQRYDKMREIEAQINELKNAEFDNLTRPVDAFITFEEEDGLIVAQEFEPEFDLFGNQKPANKEFMDDDLFLIESTEPTNIIWENRHWTTADYAKRTAQVVAIICGLLAVSFLAIYTCKSYAIGVTSVYPKVNYKRIFEDVFDNLPDPLYNAAKLENAAFRERNVPMAGYYQTFCVNKDVTKCAERDAETQECLKEVGVFDGYDKSICDDYFMDQYKMLASNQMVTIGIVAINFILRMFIIKLIIYIGKDTESEQTRLIANGVFIV